MGFIRRLSLSTADGEEPRPRNRLTKPMTAGKTSPTQRSGSVRRSPKSRSGAASVTSSQTSLAGGVARKSSKRDSRLSPKSILFEAIEEVRSPPVARSTPARKGVALLVAQFESAASASQSSLGPPVPPKSAADSYVSQRASGLLEQQRSMRDLRSKEQLSLQKNSVSTLNSTSTSSEHLTDPFAIPRRRESNYRPGEATRKASLTAKKDRNMMPRGELSLDQPDFRLYQNQKPAIEVTGEYRTPTPPVARTASPANLDRKALGGLRLGSLHVVNGRSSPVLSELSRHLISRQLRDISSEYAESIYSKDHLSETWEDADVPSDTEVEAGDMDTDGPQTPTRSNSEADTRQFSTPLGKLTDAQSLTPTSTTPGSNDKTSMMAEAYRNELQGSPFSFGSESPVSTGSIVHHRDQEQDNPESEYPVELDTGHRRSSNQSEQPSIESKPSETSDFKSRDNFASALEYQAPVFEPPPSPERGISPISLQSDAVSGHSVRADSGYISGTSTFSVHLKDVSTAYEQIPATVPTAQEQETSISQTNVGKAVTPKKEASSRKFGRFFPFRPTLRKSPAAAPAGPVLATTVVQKSANPDTVSQIPKLQETVKQPIAVMPAAITRKPVTPTKDVPRRKPVPVSSEERPNQIVNSHTVIPSPPATSVMIKPQNSQQKTEPPKDQKAAKPQNRLHKMRPRSQAREPKEIVVQRLASCESSLDLPPIPDMAKLNLQVRAEQVPELERTFKSQDHVKNQPSMSTLTLPVLDIRFPSPMPDLDCDDRLPRDAKMRRDPTRSRSRSKSRRRSFLDMFRSEKTVASRDLDQASKEDTDLAIVDFGNVLTSLGANPYAIAHSRTHSPNVPHHAGTTARVDTTPVSQDRQRRRLSMTDEEASEFARRRSHSFNGRDAGSDRQQILADNGLILGKYLRTSVTESDVPPLPPLPDKEQLRRLSQRLSMHSSQANTPTRARKMWTESPSSNRDFENSPALLSSARSPHSPLADNVYDESFASEEEIEMAPPPPSHSPAPNDLPPPPLPSHSPHPRDMEHESECQEPWDRQAQVWRERRKSAKEVLNSHRQSMDLRDSDPYHGHDLERINVQRNDFPALPLRHLGRPETNHETFDQWNDPAIVPLSDFEQNHHPHEIPAWNDSSYSPQQYEEEEFKHSRSSFQSRRRRDHPNGASQEHLPLNVASHHSPRDTSGNNLSKNHKDPSYDQPLRLSGGLNDERFFTPQTSPVRGRQMQREEYNRTDSNGYEQYYPQNYGYNPQGYPNPLPDNNYTYSSSKRPISQQFPFYQPSPSPSRSRHASPNYERRQSLAPPSPAPSRPLSRHSNHSKGLKSTPVHQIQPDGDSYTYSTPDFGRYSGGLEYGYEGLENGVGGSAGTRGDNGRAGATFKGMHLRGSHGVDLGDVPFIGVVKKVR